MKLCGGPYIVATDPHVAVLKAIEAITAAKHHRGCVGTAEWQLDYRLPKKRRGQAA